MSFALRLAGVVILATTIVAGGCSKAAATPKEAVTNMAKGMEKNDKDLFMASIYAGDGNQELVEAMFNATTGLAAFSKDMEKAYGKDAIPGMARSSPLLSDDDLAKMEIKEDGDKATAKFPTGKSTLQLIKKDGKWLVDASKDLPPAADRNDIIKSMKKVTEAMAKVRPNIGKSGYTAQKINEEMQKAMQGS